MKLWVDDVRPAPEGYIGVKSVNDAIYWILTSERMVKKALDAADNGLVEREFRSRGELLDQAERWELKLIDVDHDAGNQSMDGGNYIRILTWLEMTGRNYPIRIHSIDPAVVDDMRRIISRNGWTEYF